MKHSAKAKPAMVYMVRNTSNGKRYIGVTTHSNLRRRQSEHICGARRVEHNGMFHRAIRKYGPSVFEWSVLARCETAKEALLEEVRLIAELKPEYNSTRGGEYPPPPTPEMRAEISRRNKGKQYRLGKKMSAETKEILRLAAIEQWKSGRGDNSKRDLSNMSRVVVCLNDGNVFESASSAARFYKISKSSVISVCLKYKKHKTADGFVFRYFGEHEGGKIEADAIISSIYAERKETGSVNQVGVICIEDGKKYRSYQQAADAYGLDPVSISCVCRGVRNRKTVGGLHFKHSDGVE